MRVFKLRKQKNCKTDQTKVELTKGELYKNGKISYFCFLLLYFCNSFDY